MIVADFSVESIPNIRLRRKVERAHRESHRLSGEMFAVNPETARRLGSLLAKSPDLDHQLDSGWLALHAAWQVPTDERPIYFSQAKRAWKTVKELAPNPTDHIKARLALAFLPTFREIAQEDVLYTESLFNRVVDVNKGVLDHRLSPNMAGISNEAAVVGLLIRHTHFGQSDFLAWPAMPWHDAHHNASGNTSTNYDVEYGQFPGVAHKIQVKANFDGQEAVKKAGTDDGDVLAEWWQAQYDADIALVFGDVHLGNVPDEAPFAINQIFVEHAFNPNNQWLNAATRNILAELR